MTTRNLEALFAPSAIALVGASNEPHSGAITTAALDPPRERADARASRELGFRRQADADPLLTRATLALV